MIWHILISESLSVYGRYVVGLLSVCSGLSVCCRLRVQHFANDRFSIGVMSVIYRSQIGRFHTESYPTWTRLVLRCLQQHCRWPTAGRFIENYVFYVGFVSVWPVWLGFNECFQCSIFCLHQGMWALSLRWCHNERDCVSNHQPRHCLLNRLFGRRSKKTSKLRVTGLCAGNSPGTGEFPAQMASYAENVSIWWRHYVDTESYREIGSPQTTPSRPRFGEDVTKTNKQYKIF